MGLKEERQEAAGEVWQHEASMEAVERHKKLWFSNSTEAIRWVRNEARQFYTDNPQVAAHLFEVAAIFEHELSAAKQQLDEAEKDANRWRSFPAFLEKYQINYVGLLKDIDEYNAEAARQK